MLELLFELLLLLLDPFILLRELLPLLLDCPEDGDEDEDFLLLEQLELAPESLGSTELGALRSFFLPPALLDESSTWLIPFSFM